MATPVVEMLSFFILLKSEIDILSLANDDHNFKQELANTFSSIIFLREKLSTKSTEHI